MNRLHAPALVALLLAVANCATAQNPSAIQADMKGCGPAAEHFYTGSQSTPNPPHSPPPGKASVYFLDLFSAPVRIGMDGNWAGAIKYSSYAELDVAPGLHHLCEWRQGRLNTPLRSAALYRLNAAAGESYYFLVNVGGTSLDPINPDQAHLMMATSKFGLYSQKRLVTTRRHRAKPQPAGGQK